MIRLEEQVVVGRSQRDCFRYLVDFSTIEQWDPGVFRAEKLTPGAPHAGSRFFLELNSAGRRVPMHYCLESIVPGKELFLTGEGKGFTVADRICFHPISDQLTRIQYVAEMHFTGPAGRIEPVLRPWLKRVGRRAVEGLQQALAYKDAVERVSLASRFSRQLILPEAWAFTRRGYLKMPDKSLSEFMAGKVVVITGPTSGLGLQASCELARLGARLILVGRDSQRMAAAVKAIRDFSGCDPAMISCYQAELSLLSSVRQVAAQIRAAEPRLDVLLNNAGALFDQRQLTPEGLERALAVNLLSPLLLTQELMPCLVEGHGRVIHVASGGLYLQPVILDDMNYCRGDYDGSKAYAKAKRALVIAGQHQADRYWKQGVTINSMHPGWAATSGVEKSLPAFYRRMQPWLRDARMGADTMVWLASAAAVTQCTGDFWFDRQPRPLDLLPGTRLDDNQQQQLMNWIDQQLSSVANE